MHNSYYFILQLCKELEGTLLNAVLVECYSQHKDELVLHVVNRNTSFFIRADLRPGISCLSFPRELHRAKKNSVDLFQVLIGHKITAIRSFENERCFSIKFEREKELLFKMFGDRSNILLFDSDICVDLFRKQLVEDSTIKIENLSRKIDWSKESFFNNHQQLKGYYFTFGKPVWDYLHSQNFDIKSKEEQWKILTHVKSKLESPEIFYIEKEPVRLNFFSLAQPCKTFNNAVAALNAFYHELTFESTLAELKNKSISVCRKKIKAAENYIQKTSEMAKDLETAQSYKQMADLLMANMHQIPRGANEITLQDFEGEKNITIKLKPDLSIQKTAYAYYRKAKNQQIQIHKLQEAITQKQEDIRVYLEAIEQINSSVDIKTLKNLIAKYKLEQVHQSEKIILPFHEFTFNNYQILVGKHASANDELTLKHTYKEDLWLHAKDVAGSHVVIKHQAGKNFPKDVIERAAQLAAYHSKRKTESLCPVIYTPKKFVRKRKGSAPGEVVVEREQVIMVEPKPA